MFGLLHMYQSRETKSTKPQELKLLISRFVNSDLPEKCKIDTVLQSGHWNFCWLHKSFQKYPAALPSHLKYSHFVQRASHHIQGKGRLKWLSDMAGSTAVEMHRFGAWDTILQLLPPNLREPVSVQRDSGKSHWWALLLALLPCVLLVPQSSVSQVSCPSKLFFRQ